MVYAIHACFKSLFCRISYQYYLNSIDNVIREINDVFIQCLFKIIGHMKFDRIVGITYFYD